MYVNQNKNVKNKKVGKIRPGLEPWKKWKVRRLTPPSHHVYYYNLKKLPDPLVSPGTKFLSYLGDYVSISIMEQALGYELLLPPKYASSYSQKCTYSLGNWDKDKFTKN